MAATKQEFILKITKDLLENPRRILGSHGIPMNILRRIENRPDVMSTLAEILFMTKRSKIGARGLRRNPGISIKGYKNLLEFKKRSQADIDEFIATLGDQPFSLTDNIVTIVIRPEATVEKIDLENEKNIKFDIANKPSVMLEFPKAIGKKYDTVIRGSYFLNVMWSDAILRPIEESKAKRFESRNNRVLVRRTPAKLKAELIAKVKSHLGELYTKTKELEEKREPIANQLKEYRHLGSKLGTKGISAQAIIRALNNRGKVHADFDSSLKSLSDLDPQTGSKYRSAHQLVKAGKLRPAKGILGKAKANVNAVTASGLQNHILSNKPTVDDIISKRSGKLSGNLSKLEAHLGKLQNDLKSATPENKDNIRSLMSKTNNRIKELRAREGIYKNPITKEGISKAQRTYKHLNAEILNNIKQGIGMKEALNNALAEIDATPQEKLQLKQQILSNITSGTPMKYATQQATQKVLAQQGGTGGKHNGGMLIGSKKLKELIDAL